MMNTLMDRPMLTANEIANILNLPLSPAGKGQRERYESAKRRVPVPDEVFMAAAFASWLYRMTGEENLVMDIAKEGLYYQAELALNGKTSFEQVYDQVKQALLQPGSQKLSGHVAFADTILNEEHVLFQMVQEEDSYFLAGNPLVINPLNAYRYKESIQELAEDAEKQKERAIADLSILTEEEIELWKRVNATEKSYPTGETLQDIFSKTAKKHPDKTAISSAEGKISFNELDKKSNAIAHYLMEEGIQTGDYVSVFMDRSIDAIASMLGVMKAGAVYVPLSPENPKERNAYIMQDADTRLVITSEDCLEAAKEIAPSGIRVVEISEWPGEREAVQKKAAPEDIAYIIYTSGSTGKPKGVKIPHKSIITFGYAEQDLFQVTEHDIITQFYTLTFDASLLELCPLFFSGAQLYMLTKEERLDVSAFSRAIIREGITAALMLPMSALKQFSLYASEEEASIINSLRMFGVGGEALAGETARLFQRKFPDLALANVYGPTECSVLSTTHIIDQPVPEEQVNVPIGKPLHNYSVYVVNEHDQLNPIGVPGELLIETEGLSEGYLNLPEKTDEVFVYTSLNGKRVYRSGDIVKLLEDGTLEFVGRKDSQVKIRGYRVELGEIEDALLKADFIEDGAIVAKEVDGDTAIVAYYALKEEETASQKMLLDVLAAKLPKYMMPSYLIELPELPFLPSGKINRKELEAHPLDRQQEQKENEQKKSPSSPAEEQILNAWKEVLGIRHIGVDENFFEIGGHSLKVLGILTKLKKDFPSLKINDFFIYPTVEQLAEKAENDQALEETENTFHSMKETKLFEHPKTLASTAVYPEVKQTDILLTGVTGYLGAHILLDLIRDTDATIYPLIRAEDEQKAAERLKEAVALYAGEDFYDTYHLQDRVVVLKGDFTKPDLGLSNEDKEKVLEKVNAILHCGADVRHFGDKETFTKTNVASTEYLLEWAEALTEVRFHYVSTLGIPEDLALEGNWDAFLQKERLADAPDVDSLYTNSKLESEKLVEEAHQKGMPVNIYRPGNITCQYKTGVFQKNIDDNAVYRMLKGFILLGKAPDVDYAMDFTMVDFASKAITTVAMQPDTNGGVYHICNKEAIRYKTFIQAVRDYGYTVELLPEKEYQAYLYSDEPKNAEGLELAMAGLEGDGAKNSPLVYACPQTEDVLTREGIHMPTADTAFIHRMLDHAIERGYLKEPSC